MSRLPAALEQELEELGRFRVRHTVVVDQVILTAKVRRVPVVLYLDTDTYPAEPPRLEIAREWLGSQHGRPIRELDSLDQWNRTLGIGTLLRELEQRFVKAPPKQSSRLGGGLIQAFRETIGKFTGLVRRLFGRRRQAAAGSSGGLPDPSMTQAIRARYDEIIQEKTSRVERYKAAVAQLMSQWQRKRAGLEALGREIQNLEHREEDRLAEAERLVVKLKEAGQPIEQIKSDARYRRCFAAYEDLSADLAERQERLTELEQDAEEHLAKIREHEARLEALVRELEELQDESDDIEADLATIQLEQEIADVRAGISRAGSDRELQDLLRQFRKAKAVVRITREAADLDDDAQDAEYLEVARKVDAARQFEQSVGLGDTLAGRDSVGDEPVRE